MELSHYLKTFPDSRDKGQVILFSTKQASKVRVPKRLFQELSEQVSVEHASILGPLGMVTEDRHREIREMEYYFEKRATCNTALEFTIVLNLDCNFACAYCFEEVVKKKKYMTPDTADRLVNYIRNDLENSGKDLLVDFYGGEPLLSLAVLERIAGCLKSAARQMAKRFSFRLITNGALFTRQVAETLVSLGLTGVKITLDGPPEIHNQTRPFKNGSPSFDVILENIRTTCDLTGIEIGGNYLADNYSRFIELLDMLEASGLTPEKILSVKFDPVFQALANSSSAGRKSELGCKSVNEPWIIKAEQLLRGEILRHGYNTPKPTPLCCMVENPDSMVLGYDGRMYKCPCFIDVDDYSAGHINTGITDYRKRYGLDTWKNPECLHCEYLPLCFGGCRYTTYIQTGKIAGTACRKPYLDAALETAVMQDLILRSR